MSVKGLDEIQLSSDESLGKEMDGEDKNEETKIFVKLFGKSSIIGIPQIFTTRNIIRKFLWGSVLITGLTFCIVKSYHFMTEFEKYPVVINLEIENRRILQFPAVTICNLNSVRKNYRQLLFFPEIAWDFPIFVPPEAKFDMLTPFRKEIVECGEDKKPKEEVQFYNKYFSLNETTRSEIGHQIEDLVTFATFNTKEVDPKKDFQSFLSTRFGPCYTFNSQVQNSNKTRLHFSRSIGSQSGLTLNLDIQLNEYIDKSKSVGARVVVHSPYELPDTEGKGVNILPGTETTITMKKVSTKRLPSPYKDKCKDYKIEAADGNKRLILNELDCAHYCLQESNKKECNCTDPTIEFEEITNKCDLNNNAQVCCLDKVFSQVSKEGFKECDCKLACLSTSYEKTTSVSSWPSPESSYRIPESKNFNYLNFRESHAKLNIYYSTLEETTYVQRPAYQNSEWYSHLGGQLGLWLGISLPAIFDCSETILLLIYYSVIRCLQRCPHKTTNKTPTETHLEELYST